MKPATLGDLEKEAMDILWDSGGCSVKEVLLKLRKNHILAYTTVGTILQRLYDKKLVERKQEKNGYIYTPKISKELYSKQVANSFLKKFVDSFGDSAIASFAESIDKLPEEKRDYFLKLLNQYDKSK